MAIPTNAASFVLRGFRHLLELDRTYCEEIGRTIPIPTFPEDIIIQLCKSVQTLFEHCETVIDLHAPFYIVGDIHGNIFDLLRIFIHAGPPPHSRFLFLGDYVDRGEYSIEVIALLFALLLIYPDHVFLLRGNHEFEAMNVRYGFFAEISNQYQSRVLHGIVNAAFQWMPLIAILDDKIFCVHGGIAPHAKNLNQLRKIKRPIATSEVDFVGDLMWSDPSQDSKTFDESARGLGVQFGVKALQDFLAAMNMTLLLRAHQCISNGISRFGGELLYTIFSCSQYEGQCNRCGLMFMSLHLQIELFSLPPLNQVPRAEALLQPFVLDGNDQEMQISDCLALNGKLFTGPPKWKWPAKGLACVKKENLLQNFQRVAPAMTSRIKPLLPIEPPPRAVSVEGAKRRSRLPSIADLQAQSATDGDEYESA